MPMVNGSMGIGDEPSGTCVGVRESTSTACGAAHDDAVGRRLTNRAPRAAISGAIHLVAPDAGGRIAAAQVEANERIAPHGAADDAARGRRNVKHVGPHIRGNRCIVVEVNVRLAAEHRAIGETLQRRNGIAHRAFAFRLIQVRPQESI